MTFDARAHAERDFAAVERAAARSGIRVELVEGRDRVSAAPRFYLRYHARRRPYTVPFIGRVEALMFSLPRAVRAQQGDAAAQHALADA